MKTLKTIALFLLGCAAAHAAPVIVQSAQGTCSSLPSLSGVAAGDSIIIFTSSLSATAPTFADTAGETLTNDVAWVNVNGNGIYMGVWRADNVAAGTHAVGSTCSGAVNFGIIEVSGLLSSGSFDASSVVAGTNNSTTVTTNSATPAASGELALVIVNANNGSTATISSFGSGWSTIYAAPTNNTPWGWADQIGGSSPISTTITFSSAMYSEAMVVLYKQSSTSSCSHTGFAIDGTKSIPNGTSGTYMLYGGTNGTPDCSTIKYCNTAGTCAVN